MISLLFKSKSRKINCLFVYPCLVKLPVHTRKNKLIVAFSTALQFKKFVKQLKLALKDSKLSDDFVVHLLNPQPKSSPHT